MEIIVQTQKSKIVTDNPKLLKALCDLYTFKVQGASFSPSYRRGHWDGKKRFITKKGSFRSGLLPRILKDLGKIECYPKITYTDKANTPPDLDTIEGFTYYDYQEVLINRALESGRGVIKSPTGSGKTLIMAGLIKSLIGRKMVILFNAKQLLTQTYDFLTETCGMDNVGLCYGEGYIDGDIMLCTVQSIEKILDKYLDTAEVLMVDECHEFCSGKITLPAIQAFTNATYRFGFTATTPSEPEKLYALEGALGEIIEEFTTKDLIEQGTLTKPYVRLIEREYSADGRDEDLGYMGVYDDYIVQNLERNQIIKEVVDDIRSKNKKARILILTKSLSHGRLIQESLGGGVEYLEGANSLGERYESIDKFKQADGNSVLIGTKILQTGVNIQEITHFINARGMKSEVATIQALGRALRKHETKTEVIVYDFLDKEKYLKSHSNLRKKHYKSEGHDIEIIKWKN